MNVLYQGYLFSVYCYGSTVHRTCTIVQILIFFFTRINKVLYLICKISMKSCYYVNFYCYKPYNKFPLNLLPGIHQHCFDDIVLWLNEVESHDEQQILKVFDILPFSSAIRPGCTTMLHHTPKVIGRIHISVDLNSFCLLCNIFQLQYSWCSSLAWHFLKSNYQLLHLI